MKASIQCFAAAGAALLVGLLGAMAVARPACHANAQAGSATVAIDSLRESLARIENALGIQKDSGDFRTMRAAYVTLRARIEAIAAQGEDALKRIPTLSPVENGVITSPYTPRRLHPIRRVVLPHFGLDIAARRGSPIRATADGTVTETADSPTYGLTVDIDHGNGFITRYAHAQRLLVRPGQKVHRGETIALVGSTGISTGPHVHYEVFRDGWSVDPFAFLVGNPLPVGGE